MNQIISDFFNNLILHDYLLFGAVFVIFILLISLAIIIRRKIFLALLLVFMAFGILTVGPTYGYVKLHDFLFEHTATLRETKQLEFTDAVVVWGDLNNTSNRLFESCEVKASAYKVSGNAMFDWVYPLNPFKKSSIVLENIQPGETRPFKIFLEPFRYAEDYNISIGSDCR